MPSFVYSSVTVEQLDDIDGYAPSVRPVGGGRSTQFPVAQLHSRMCNKPTLIELVKQQPQPHQQPTTNSNVIVDPPAHADSINAELPPPSFFSRQKLRWSPSPNLTRDALALSFFVSVLLFCSLCLDQFALTQVALDTFSSQPSITNPSNAPTSNTLGAFTFCRAGTWTHTGNVNAMLYTFVPDQHCSRVGSECEADGWSLGLMLGRSDSVSCGLFDVFRACLLIAFFSSVAAGGLGVVYLRRPTLSPVLGVVVVLVMVAVTIATLIAGCVLQSMLPSSATHSHSFWLVIAALLLSVPCSVLFAYSEYKRLYRSSASPSEAIHSDVPPVRLTEGDDDVDERWERQRHEVSQSTYTLDDDHGALLAIERAVQQPTAATANNEQKEMPANVNVTNSSLRGRRMSVALIASQARGEERTGADQVVAEDGEVEVSVSRIDMQQAEWDEEAEEAMMEGARTERLSDAVENEQKTHEASK